MSLKSFSLTIRHSKTNQFGQRVLVLPFASCVNKRLCPVRAMIKHLGANDPSLDEPLFVFLDAGVKKRLTHSKFTSELKLHLTRAGFDSSNISPHSFRRGGTSFAINQAGMSPIVVKSRGDWSSNAYEKYVFLIKHSTMRAARLIALAADRAV